MVKNDSQLTNLRSGAAVYQEVFTAISAGCGRTFCCRWRNYRQEALESQFDNIVKRITLDTETVGWVKKALQESLKDETEFQKETVSMLTKQLEQCKKRINKAYLDKIDGKITEEYWAEKNEEWQQEKADISEKLTQHMKVDDYYIEDGVRIMELANRAYELYSKQNHVEKRKLLSLLLSNCTLRDGVVTHKYRQPFDILVFMTKESARNKPSK